MKMEIKEVIGKIRLLENNFVECSENKKALLLDKLYDQRDRILQVIPDLEKKQQLVSRKRKRGSSDG